MSKLHAFVGHSFNPEDDVVVGKFLRYFEQLSSVQANFSWTHAEAAEPKVLAEKVITLLEQANVFIAICTRKELVLLDSKTKTQIPFTSKQILDERNLVWKTSDWIIQEIGLAIGRQLSIVLFVENGVRSPGGLQGNLEYISFDRTNPEAAFGKFNEMIGSLAPRSNVASIPSSEKTSPSADAETPETPDRGREWTPRPEWRRFDYEHAFTMGLHFPALINSDDISDAYLRTEEANSNGEKRASWIGYTELMRIVISGAGSLSRLRELQTENPASAISARHFASGLAHYGNFSEAAAVLDATCERVENNKDKMMLLSRAALNYCKDRNFAESNARVNRMRGLLAIDNDLRDVMIGNLVDIFEAEDRKDALLAVMELAAIKNPEDIASRFSLAYKHSQVENNDMALLHYKKIPDTERTGITWNNLGAAFDEFSAPSSAVRAYRKAEEMNEPLAMTNLASRLLRRGFVSEARELCDKALSTDKSFKQAAALLASIGDEDEVEEKLIRETIEKAAPKSEFYRAFGNRILLASPEVVGEKWKGPKCALSVKLYGARFHAVGSYEVELTGFASLLGSALKEKRIVEYSGELLGRAVVGTVKDTREGEERPARGLLGVISQEREVLLYFSEDLSRVHALEDPHSKHSKFYDLLLNRRPLG